MHFKVCWLLHSDILGADFHLCSLERLQAQTWMVLVDAFARPRPMATFSKAPYAFAFRMSQLEVTSVYLYMRKLGFGSLCMMQLLGCAYARALSVLRDALLLGSAHGGELMPRPALPDCSLIHACILGILDC